MAVGWFGEDIWDAATGAVESVAESALDVLHVIPGAEDLTGALSDVLKGPLREFANNPFGLIILRAMATTIGGPLAWQIGPQLASFTWALPGVARGQDFWEAWFTEVKWRTEKTAEIVAPGMAEQAIKPLLDLGPKLTAMFPEGLDALPIAEIASRFGVSENFGIAELKGALRKRWVDANDWTAAMVRSLIDPDRFPIPREGNFDDAGSYLPGKAPPNPLLDLTGRSFAELSYRPTTVAQASWGDNLFQRLTGQWYEPPAPTPPLEVGGAPESVTKKAGDAALVLVIAAAAGTFAWWYLDEKKRRRS